ncbi:unnamed protein product, partial [Hymenolepis diminuta]
FTHAPGSNYYFPPYSEFSDAQGQLPAPLQSQPISVEVTNDVISMADSLPVLSSQPQNLDEAITDEVNEGSRYYTTMYNNTALVTANSQQRSSDYLNYVQYESSPLPSYMWPQTVEGTTWEGVSTDYVYTDTRYPEQQQSISSQRVFEAVDLQPQTQNQHQNGHNHHIHQQGQSSFPEGIAISGTSIEVTPVPIACGGFAQPKIAEYQLDGSMKPPFSYITLIVSAMMSNKEKRATLSEIYAWIMNHFAYYRKNTKRWQNSVRHALSFNDCFTKVPRPPGETGKGAYWTLHEGATGMFENGSSIRRCRKFVDEQRVRPRSGRSRRKKMQDGSSGSKECQLQPPSLRPISNSIPSSTTPHFPHTTEVHEAQLQLPPSLQPISSLQHPINYTSRLISIPDSSRDGYMLGM